MTQIKRIGIDTSKAVFTLHGVDQAGQPVLRTNLRRAQMIPFFKKSAADRNCHGSLRQLASLGSIAGRAWPQRAPASTAICETLREARQERPQRCRGDLRGCWAPEHAFRAGEVNRATGEGMVLKVRETLVGQRTQLVNALRGHAAEFGVIAAKGIRQIPPLLEAIAAETAIPSDAREMLALFGQEIDHLDTRLKAIEVKLIAMHKANRDQPAVGHHPGHRSAHRADPGNRGRSGSVQIRPSSGGLARTGAKGTFDRLASNAWAASAVLAMNGCASCW